MPVLCRPLQDLSGFLVFLMHIIPEPKLCSVVLGTCNAGRQHSIGPGACNRAYQPAVHYTLLLCLTSASALPANNEAGEELSAISLGPLCHALKLVCDSLMSVGAISTITIDGSH